jgi:tol-pal system protein YbgF
MAEYFLSKKNLGRGGLFFLILLLASCVTTEEEMRYLNEQIGALNKRVSSLQESVDQKSSSEYEKQGQIYSSLESVRDRQADNVAEIQRIREQMQGLTGRVEENSHLVKRSVERDTTEQDEMKRKLAEFIERLDKLEANVRHVNSYLGLEPGGEARKSDQEKSSKEVKTEARAEAKTEAPQTPVDEKEPVSPEKRLYELTLKLYREGKYEEAIEGFENFLKKYPKSDLADNAEFWIGESYMSLKQYEQAILAYQEVIKNYPKGNKVPSAMLRQAQAFYEVKDNISSKILLKKIIKQFPSSSEAKIAKARLEKM